MGLGSTMLSTPWSYPNNLQAPNRGLDAPPFEFRAPYGIKLWSFEAFDKSTERLPLVPQPRFGSDLSQLVGVWVGTTTM
jgi:hypothetical protein